MRTFSDANARLLALFPGSARKCLSPGTICRLTTERLLFRYRLTRSARKTRRKGLLDWLFHRDLLRRPSGRRFIAAPTWIGRASCPARRPSPSVRAALHCGEQALARLQLQVFGPSPSVRATSFIEPTRPTCSATQGRRSFAVRQGGASLRHVFATVDAAESVDLRRPSGRRFIAARSVRPWRSTAGSAFAVRQGGASLRQAGIRRPQPRHTGPSPSVRAALHCGQGPAGTRRG